MVGVEWEFVVGVVDEVEVELGGVNCFGWCVEFDCEVGVGVVVEEVDDECDECVVVEFGVECVVFVYCCYDVVDVFVDCFGVVYVGEWFVWFGLLFGYGVWVGCFDEDIVEFGGFFVYIWNVVCLVFLMMLID